MATTQIKNGFHGGSDDQLLVNPDGSINVNTSGGGGGNASVGATGATAPTSATEIGAVDANGKLQPLLVDPDGKLLVDVSGNTTVSGAVVPAGLRTAGRITTMLVGVTAVQLPATALANRNAMSITNLSSQILYIGFDASVTADSAIGTTAGWEVGIGEGFNIDITNNIPLYGIVASGTALIKIMELS